MAPVWQLMLLAAAAVPGILIVTPVMHLVFFGLTLAMLPVTMFVLMLMLGMATPLVQSLRRPYVLPLLPLLAAAALLAGGSLTGASSAEQPQPDNLSFAQNAMDGTAYWVSEDARLDSWTAPLFGPQPQQRRLTAIDGPDARRAWVQPTPALPLPAPTIRLVSDARVDGKRMVAVDIASPRAAPVISASVEGIAVTSSRVQGRISGSGAVAAGKWRIDASGLQATPVRIELVVPPGQPFTVRVQDRSYGLPAGPGQRAPAMLVQPFGTSDATRMVRTMTFD
jgi:hypothetical protein